MVRRNWAESWMCGERFAGFTKVVDSSAGPQPQSRSDERRWGGRSCLIRVNLLQPVFQGLPRTGEEDFTQLEKKQKCTLK